MGLWNDIKIMGRGLRDSWRETEMAADTRALTQPFKDHLAEVKRLNAEAAARDEAVHGYEARQKQKIADLLNQVSAASLALDAHNAEKLAEAQAGDQPEAQADQDVDAAVEAETPKAAGAAVPAHQL